MKHYWLHILKLHLDEIMPFHARSQSHGDGHRVLQNRKSHTFQITCLYFYLPWRYFRSRGKKRAGKKNGQTRALQELLSIRLQTLTCKANHLQPLAGLAHQQNENGTRSSRGSFRMTHNLIWANELIQASAPYWLKSKETWISHSPN